MTLSVSCLVREKLGLCSCSQEQLKQTGKREKVRIWTKSRGRNPHHSMMTLCTWKYKNRVLDSAEIGRMILLLEEPSVPHHQRFVSMFIPCGWEPLQYFKGISCLMLTSCSCHLTNTSTGMQEDFNYSVGFQRFLGFLQGKRA